MIEWSQIKPLITSQIVTLSDLPANNVRWVDEPSGPLGGVSPVVYLRIASIVDVGDDEERFDENGDDDQTVIVCGQREFTLSVRCESFTPDIADSRSAAAVIEKIKTRWFRTSSFQERAGVFGVLDCLGVKWFNYIADKRPVSTYIADFKCITVDNDEDLSPDTGAWIGEVLINSTNVNDVDGNPLPTQVSLDVNAK